MEGDVREVGSVRRASIQARSYTLLGTGKVVGDATLGRGDVQGFLTVGGRLAADEFRCDGGLEVGSTTTVKGHLDLRGDAELGGAVSAGEVHSKGTVRVAGSIQVNGLATIDGVLVSTGPVTTRGLTLTGGLTVGGTIEAPTVTIRLRKASRATSILSPHVRIVRASPFLSSSTTLAVDRIEGVEVELEGVDCEYVRAERVRLGAGCHVTRLDGAILRRHRTAVVGPLSRVDPPFGMSR